MIRTWLNALSLLLVLECTNTLLAQEAASDVVGFIEVNVVPGKSEPLAPLFLPALSGSGTVKAVADAGRLTPEWFGVLPEPNDTAAWFPLSGAFIGTPIFGLEIEDSKDWSISPDFRGNPFTGAAPDSPLQVSDRFAVVPFWTVDELAGPADSGSVFSSPSRAQADTFSFAGNTVWAGKPETDLARWVTWVSENPGDEDVGSSVIPDVMGPAAYLRNSVATSPIRLFVHGAARPSALSFHIMPGVEGATDPPVTPLFRPDGKEFTLSSHLGLYTNNPATGLVGGAGPETADKLVIWSADIQEWERFYYKTTAPIGWKSLRPRTINPATIKVPSGSSFFVERPSTRPALKLSLPTIPNAALVNTTLFAQIIDTDKDRLADGWEKTAGDKTLAMLPGADGDGDGFTNLEEYLLGGDPVVFDHPAMPLVEVRVLPTGVREAWLTFTTSLGCRYRVEKRLATSTSWAAIGAILTGTGDELEVKDPVALSTVDRAPRFYRVVGLAPADTDADLLSDFEEVSVYETNPATADTDLDGVKDGAEVRTAGRNPLDYYDGRAVSFLVDAVSDRQVTAPGQWLRQSIAFTAKSGTKALINAPVTFSLTNGAGKFSVVPGDHAAAMPVLTVRTDASGKARAFLYVASASGIVQGRAVARVNDAGSGTLDQIYSASFITYVSPHLTVPTEGLVRWFRPDVGVNRIPSSAEVASWSSVEESGVASAVNQIGPTQITDLGRAWLAFTGTEKLDMGSGLLPNNTFNAFFTAAPSFTRTEPAPSVASTALNAGATGQAYLLAGETVNGQTVIVYDPPAKPADRSFSIWTITDFRAYNGDTIFRKYAFPTATGRHDGTDGYRNTPAPVGDHNPVTQAGIEPSFATSFPNHRFDSSYTRTVNFNTSLGFKYAEEGFYKVYATDWKGNSASATYGGVKRIDYSRVGAAGLGLSVGANSTGAFELHQYWKPAISANGIYSSATGFSTPKTFIGSLRVVNKIPYLDVGGYRRITGSTAYSKSTAVLAPRFIGGWETTGNGYKGKLGDLLLYNRDLTTAECYQVEDYLAASYRGVYELDRDKDTLPDWWERAFFGNYAQAAAGDSDGDTSNNAEEYAKGTHPGKGDTDGDGWSDKLEITKKSNPLTWDSDYDLIADALDTLFLNASNGQADADNNGIADGIDQLILNHDLQDSDSDGISDMLEAFWLSTGVLLDDSDGDLLPDGFEFYGGLDPLDSTGNNGTHGNPDNDGLDNLDELIYSTNPSAADTDGDGVNDGVEINQGTDPNKLGDGGTPPPPEELIDVPFSVGDSSGSHSERWAMKIVSTNSALDSKTLNFQAPSFGEVGSKTFKLRKGCGYTLTLQHLGTDPEYLKGSQGKPDYDWTAKVDNKPSSSVLSPDETGQYFAITGNGATWIVDNSSGLLGSSDDSLGEQGNKTVGLAASLLPVEINVNDTADAKDDMVRKEQRIGTTAWRQWIPCTVKIPSASSAQITSIGVTAEGGTMKFSDAQTKPSNTDAGAANVNVTLDAQGQGKFWITGITQSANKGDAKLQIRKNGATGDVLATQPMTVFWFDATITFPSQSAASKAGNLYGITNPQYAWAFSGEATIKPTGLDSTAPQIANMRLGFIQNVQTTRTWHVNNPSVQAGSGAPSSSTVTVASTRIGTVTWQSYVLDRRSPQSRMLRDQTPLYDGYEAFDASGKSSISNDDSPQAPADAHSKAAQAVQANQTWPVTVDYQWEKTVIQDDFLLWLGVADDADTMGLLPNPTSVTPIRQVDWKFHADSSANGLQTPTGGTHKAPDTVPVVTGQTANQRGASPASYQWQDGNQNTNLHP